MTCRCNLVPKLQDKVCTLEGKLLARIKQNPSPPSGRHPGGKVILVEDK